MIYKPIYVATGCIQLTFVISQWDYIPLLVRIVLAIPREKISGLVGSDSSRLSVLHSKELHGWLPTPTYEDRGGITGTVVFFVMPARLSINGKPMGSLNVMLSLQNTKFTTTTSVKRIDAYHFFYHLQTMLKFSPQLDQPRRVILHTNQQLWRCSLWTRQ